MLSPINNRKQWWRLTLGNHSFIVCLQVYRKNERLNDENDIVSYPNNSEKPCI